MTASTSTVFVAGATGAIGRRVVPSLVAAGHRITAAGRNPAQLRRLEELGARTVAMDLLDPRSVHDEIAASRAEVIINLTTAVPRPGPRMFLPWSWHPMDRVRRQVSRNLVDAALAGGTAHRFVQESFAPIYADAGDRWIDERFPVRPARYDRSVLAAEAQAERFTGAGRVGVVLRFGMFYGPGDPATATLLAAVRRGWFPLFGRPEAFAAWVAHHDAASAVVATLAVPAGIYNVVDDEPLRRRDLADRLAAILGVRPLRLPPAWATPLGGVVGETLARSLRISNRKLREAGGWAPRYRSALEGLAALLTAERVAA